MGRFMKECSFALVVGPSHAVPEHPHRAGSGGDVVCLDRGCPGAVCLIGRQRSLQSFDSSGKRRVGGSGAPELGSELLRSVMSFGVCAQMRESVCAGFEA